MINKMNMSSELKLAGIPVLSGIPVKQMPNFRFLCKDKEMKNGRGGILFELPVGAREIRWSDTRPSERVENVIHVIFVEDGRMLIAAESTINNHPGYIKVAQNDFMAELNRFALSGRGEKLREIVGDALFNEISKRIHRSLDELVTIVANSVISVL